MTATQILSDVQRAYAQDDLEALTRLVRTAAMTPGEEYDEVLRWLGARDDSVLDDVIKELRA